MNHPPVPQTTVLVPGGRAHILRALLWELREVPGSFSGEHRGKRASKSAAQDIHKLPMGLSEPIPLKAKLSWGTGRLETRHGITKNLLGLLKASHHLWKALHAQLIFSQKMAEPRRAPPRTMERLAFH